MFFEFAGEFDIVSDFRINRYMKHKAISFPG